MRGTNCTLHEYTTTNMTLVESCNCVVTRWITPKVDAAMVYFRVWCEQAVVQRSISSLQATVGRISLCS